MDSSREMSVGREDQEASVIEGGSAEASGTVAHPLLSLVTGLKAAGSVMISDQLRLTLAHFHSAS